MYGDCLFKRRWNIDSTKFDNELIMHPIDIVIIICDHYIMSFSLLDLGGAKIYAFTIFVVILALNCNAMECVIHNEGTRDV